MHGCKRFPLEIAVYLPNSVKLFLFNLEENTLFIQCILKPSSNRSSNIFTLVQKVKIGHTKRFNSKDKSRLCRDSAGYFISK